VLCSNVAASEFPDVSPGRFSCWLSRPWIVSLTGRSGAFEHKLKSSTAMVRRRPFPDDFLSDHDGVASRSLIRAITANLLSTADGRREFPKTILARNWPDDDAALALTKSRNDPGDN
jgi:hypothetical protein